MDIPIKKVESNRGNPIIIIDDHKYRQEFIKKNGDIRWRCITKDYTATIYTNEQCITVLSGSYYIHTRPNHWSWNAKYYERPVKERQKN